MKNSLRKLRELLLVPYLRKQIVLIRLFFFVRIKKKLKENSSKDAFDVTISHNLKGLRMCNNRMDLLIKPISAIETLDKSSKILVIGPRNENDLLSLYACGFSWKNIYGVDLITYSDRILLGDMHELPFNDNFFDAVLCGWTLSYSANPEKAAREMIRVSKDNGIIGIGVEYSTMNKGDSEHLLGYSIQDFNLLSKRINSTEEILSLFNEKVDCVFFNHNAPNRISHSREGYAKRVSNVVTIFSVNKKGL